MRGAYVRELIAFRAVQGLGGGAIQALAFAVLGDILPPRERGRYIGYFTLAFVGAALLGPLIGGFIIDHLSWPWIFFVNVPLGIVADDRPGGGPGRLDQRRVLVLPAVAVVPTATNVAVGRRAREPIIPLRLFRDRAVVTATLLGMGAGTIASGAGQFLPLYFQDSIFVSPTESGLRMLPRMLGVTIGAFGIGRLIARTGACKPWPILGTAVAVAGLLVVSRVSGDTSYGTLVVPMVARGSAWRRCSRRRRSSPGTRSSSAISGS